MTDIESTTRRLADETGAPTGPHEVDGQDLVRLAAGWTACLCAKVADDGGDGVKMLRTLIDQSESGRLSGTEQRFASEIVNICAGIAQQHPGSPGDAIREAFLWTGWCHGVVHGTAVMVHVRLQRPGQPPEPERDQLEQAFAGSVIAHLVTSEAVYAAFCASRHGEDTFWARKWKVVKAQAMAEMFPAGVPSRTYVRLRFSSSPW